MKIVQINFLDMFSTGNIMLNIANVARGRGHEAYTASKYTKDAIDRGRPDIWHYYIGSRLENTIHRYFSWMTDFQDSCSYFTTKRLIRKIEEINPDIIHLHDIVGWYVNIDVLFKYLRKKNVPVVWTFHDCWAFTGRCIYFDAAGCDRWKTGCGKCPQLDYMPRTWWFDNSAWNWKRKKKLFTGLEKLTIVTPSKWLAGLVGQSFLKDVPVKVINNGINLNIFKPSKGESYNWLKSEEKKIVLGLTALWSERKGLKDMLRLADELPADYKIVIVGTVNEDIDKPNIVHIDRTQNQAELAQIYSASDVFVNPTYEENFPTVNLEALACGTPIVTYRTGGSPESVTELTGKVVDKGDFKSLKEAVIEVCSYGRDKYSQACIAASKNYDKDARFNDYVNLYEEIFK